jgi:uncharacterized membrane protein
MGGLITLGILILLVLPLILLFVVISLSSRTRQLEDRLAFFEKQFREKAQEAKAQEAPERSVPVQEASPFAPPKEPALPVEIPAAKEEAPVPAPPAVLGVPVYEAPAVPETIGGARFPEAGRTPAGPGIPAARTEPPAASQKSFLMKFIGGGNLWAAGGVVLLIAAFGMLIAYLGRRGFFTVEMGIAAAAVTGLVLIFAGWFLRKKRPGYFLILQGGGIGILYLAVFAAHKLTPYFPAPLALALMSLLIPPALVLALFQHSQPLAVFGFLGGFAAPILLSTGGGNHVFLFSYYLILNAGVFAIEFFRSWKILKLLSFVCTFGVSVYWVMNSYTEALFPQAEPFFVIFTLLYTFLGLKSIQKGNFVLTHYGDGIVILGTPFAAALLQWKVFSFIGHGHAIITLAFSAFYLALAFLLLKRGKKASLRPYIEGYLGLSVFLANIAIPLELSTEITSALWAAEGALIFFFGLMVNRRKAPEALWDWKITASGILIHAASAIAFFAGLSRFSGEYLSWRSPEFLGALIIALSALVMAALTNKFPQGTEKNFVSVFPVIAVIWGLLWWMGGWYYEIERVLDNPGGAFLILLSLTALGTYGAARLFRSPAFYLGLIPAQAFALLFILIVYLGQIGNFYYLEFAGIFTFNFFTPPWRVGWILFFAVRILLVFLTVLEEEERKKFTGIQVFFDLLILLGVLSPSARSLTHYFELSVSWTSFAGLLPLFAAMIFLSLFYPPRLKKQFTGGERKLLFFVLPLIFACILGIWFLVTLFMPGDPAPLPFYIPLLNPLDLLEGFCVGVVTFWLLSLRKKGEEFGLPRRSLVFVLADVSVFVWFIAILGRIVHYYGGVPFRDVSRADGFHLGLFILCSLYGIAHIIGGHRFPSRRVWIAGAVLTVAGIAKLLLFDMADIGVLYRILSFFIAGVILLFIGWAAPLPPAREEGTGLEEKGHV